jgi:hypothetical protein
MSAHVGVDIGEITVKTSAGAECTEIPAPGGDPGEAIRAALASGAVAKAQACVAVRDQWLSADPADAVRLEEMRHEGRTTTVRAGGLAWTGQLAASCAFAASLAPEPAQRRYLVCDVGGTGVRAGLFTASAAVVRVEALHAERGGGWRDFDSAVRAALPSAEAARLPPDWYKQATATAERRARADQVFRNAAAGAEDDLETSAYRITVADDRIPLTAGTLIGAFEATRQRLAAAVAAVLHGGAAPDRVVLVGGLGWLPLAAHTAVQAGNPAGAPAVLGTEAAARGALLFALGAARLAPPEGLQPVAVPAHRFRNGLLEGISVDLLWTEPFAAVPDGPLQIDRGELQVLVDGQARTARLPGLARGRYLIGLRPTWPGPGLLVVRPADGGAAHLVPLTELAAQ